MIQRFITKPVEIDAIRFTGENHDELRAWTGLSFRRRIAVSISNLVSVVPEGAEIPVSQPKFSAEVYDELHDTWIKVLPGQWIVKGAKGEFYPCDDETFHWKYEEVTEQVLDIKVQANRLGAPGLDDFYNSYYEEGHQ